MLIETMNHKRVVAGEYLSYQEIRVRMTRFVKGHKDDFYEKGHSQVFYHELFSVFGIRKRDWITFESLYKNFEDNNVSVAVFIPGLLLVEQKSRGKNLDTAKEKTRKYLQLIPARDRPRYVMVSDFAEFRLYDLEDNTESFFKFEELPEKIELLWFLTGRVLTITDEELTTKASHMIGKIYRKLKTQKYQHIDILIIRLVFCMFADSTGIFPERIFAKWLEGLNSKVLGQQLNGLFEILNTEISKRQDIKSELNEFPYIDGGLFSQKINLVQFDEEITKLICEANNFNWKYVSPAIFGSLFQSIMDSEERREYGAHYTTEENILKLLKPLFLDYLYDEFKRILDDKSSTHKRLEKFQTKLSNLKFFDPACGSGNFLIIAYREIRMLELEVLKILHGSNTLNTNMLSRVNVDQFYGIEINSLSCKIAEMGLWMMDHLMNLKLSESLGAVFYRSDTSAIIYNGNALQIDWEDVLPAKECSFILGNPPYGGARTMTKSQKNNIKFCSKEIKDYGHLDYVSGWFIKATNYVQETTKIGFVATNSIVQGQAVGILWPYIFENNLEIQFAYDTFVWGSDDTGKAQVHVVIIGLWHNNGAKRLFSNDVEYNPDFITPYLIPTSNSSIAHQTVQKSSTPLHDKPRMSIGTQPIDGGHYIFTKQEKEDFIQKEPESEEFFYEYVGSKEFIQGTQRYILYLSNVEPNILRNLPLVRKRIEKVRNYRLSTNNDLAETPRDFSITTIPDGDFLLIPEVSSERREYIPIGFLSNKIPSNLSKIIPNASLSLFGILTSRMHNVWLQKIGGRLKSSYRYSINVVYNTFPFPTKNLDNLEPYAQAVLDVRDNHLDSTMADLYDPDLMPSDLKKAHRKLDRVVEKLYRKKPFKNDMERFEYLLKRYAD